MCVCVECGGPRIKTGVPQTPAKSRSFVMKKGKKANTFRFLISVTTIQTLSECLIKSIGKIFNSTLRYTNAVRTAVGDLELCLPRVEIY